MSRHLIYFFTMALGTLLAGSGAAQTPPAQSAAPGSAIPAPAAPNDYSDAKNWLCRPGRQDACAVDLSTTVVAADGSTRVETWRADPAAPIDCFYVYPTVSTDPTTNSDMTPNAAELNVAQQQFARFASQCRVYAPMYRQVTIPGLQRMLASGKPIVLDGGTNYDDVLAAWRHYLAHDNQGRGVVLIGHSQGSAILTQLLAREIDGKAIQRQLVSALLPGWPIAVPPGDVVGGVFKHLPLCQSADQIQCVIAYSSFRATSPPPANTKFGRIPGPRGAAMAACVNPAGLDDGELRPYLNGATRPATPSQAWISSGNPITSPFVSVPGLLSAECVYDNAGSYLAITVHGNPQDPRADDIAGDLVVGGQVQKDWGLHLADVNLTMGNLVRIVARQAKAYQAAVKDCGCDK
jgi:hypothetical protein